MRWQTNHHARKLGHQAFTLIELLVVIATITVLLAILLTSLNAARHMANRTKCATHLRDITIAWTAYLSDHEGRFYRGPNANTKYGGWCPSPGRSGPQPRPLNGYVGLEPCLLSPKEARLFRCPSDFGGINAFNPALPVFEDYGTSYQTNNYLIGPPVLATTNAATQTLHAALNKRITGLKSTDVDNHPQVILAGDYPWWNQTRREPKMDADWHKQKARFSLSFLDGHVGFQKIITPSFVTGDFTIVPFKDLYSLAREAEEALRTSVSK